MSFSVVALVVLHLLLLPTFSHRLITNPYPQQEWDSVIVSSDPITIRDKSRNDSSAPRPPTPQKRSFDHCPPNDFLCLYPDQQPPSPDTTHILNDLLHHYSPPKPPNNNLTHPDKHNDSSRNSHWTIVDSHTHNHPFDDRHGWVTLDPVPWSTSKISRWHPNRVPQHHQDKPWDYAPTTQRPVQQFWVSGSSFHPERPTAQWGVGTNDIITDNRPTGFPTGEFASGGYNRPDSGFYNDRNRYQQKGETLPTANRLHPSTYPSNGNGEWVLLSTTKGYSHPQRYKWPGQKDLKTIDRSFVPRRIKAADISKYHEEDLQEKLPWSGSNRKSDENPPADDSGKTPLQILYTGSSGHSGTTVRRKLRLQVLPSLVSSSTSHGGLLEVDSNAQTVDEAQQEDEKMQKLKAIANVKKSKIRGYKLVPAPKTSGKGMSETNVMTLAAVGAGMIPATMALLVPMALGKRRRRRRSLPEDLAEGRRHFF